MKLFRRVVLPMLVFVSVGTSLLFAASPPHFTKGIEIQGGYEEVASFNITPIATQSEGYMMGMPFPLNDNSVLDGKTEKGRLIAKWNVLTNNAFLIDIEAEIMHPEAENKKKDIVAYENGLGYVLNFVYNMSYYSDRKVYYIEDASFPIAVPDSIEATKKIYRDINLLQNVTLDPQSLVGSADGSIYFNFDNATSALLENTDTYASLPDGNYVANVVFTLKVKQ